MPGFVQASAPRALSTAEIAEVVGQYRDAHHTTVTWASRFEPNDPNDAESLTAHYRSLYLAGLRRLKTVLETQDR